MAKVLITLLGTGKLAKGDLEKNEYIGTDYIIDGTIYKDKKFVASAIIEHYDINKVFIIGTKESMWDNVAEYFGANEDLILDLLEKKEKGLINEEYLIKLSNVINKYLTIEGSKCFVVEEGTTEEEILKIFDKFLEILSMVSKNDVVYFDITHLFRSVSVMSLILAELMDIKEIKIGGIFYGMLSKKPPSPIVDLKVLLEFLSWARAIRDLKNYGNSTSLRNLLQKTEIDEDIKNSVVNFSYALSISHMFALEQEIKRLKGKINKFKKSESKFVNLISEDLEKFINRFSNKTVSEFQFEFAKWNIENENYAIAYIALAEAVISALCEKENIDPKIKDNRDYIKEKYLNSKTKNAFITIYNKVRNIRNAIAHQSSSKYSPKEGIDKIREYYSLLYKYVKKK
ncbi:TIGR02221 family CRISPR-associated protein [Persephonella sp. KM09-Lau-8]|uniref:TIGR02221 family CRISPR-associated protein n=1 Tax=Persephonella sp. KM09-Lau-8 TaxID=1158345 RepID=UPI000496B82E|nr:TIGR02221 family CRISPR-associated protein [Persephonella sp. KM09-Lau-8]